MTVLYEDPIRKQRQEMIYNRVLKIINASGFSYNLSYPQYTDAYCKSLQCYNEEDWTKVKSSLQEFLNYANQTIGIQYIYVLKVRITYHPGLYGGSITDDVLRVGIVRDTFQGKQIFDGIDIRY
jgi:hypothetical protein